MIELTKEETGAIVNYYKSAIYNKDVMTHLLKMKNKDFQLLMEIYHKCKTEIHGIIWHKATTRQLTAQKEANIEHTGCYVLDMNNEIVVPENGEEILIALNNGHVEVLTCEWFYDYCLLPCFEDGDKVIAWAKIPKYVEE